MKPAYVWMGVSAYPISPSTLVAGRFVQGLPDPPARRPPAAYNVADPAHPNSGDCVAVPHQHHRLHRRRQTGQPHPLRCAAPPAPPATPTSELRSDAARSPASIHANAPSTTGNCAQCHGSGGGRRSRSPPANFSIVGLPANAHPHHAPAARPATSGAGSSIAALPVVRRREASAGPLMNHAGISEQLRGLPPARRRRHQLSPGITRIVGMPRTSPVGASSPTSPRPPPAKPATSASMPSQLRSPRQPPRTAPGTAFATPAPDRCAQIHTGITGGCAACHEAGAGVDGRRCAYPIAPTTLITAGASVHRLPDAPARRRRPLQHRRRRPTRLSR